MKHSWITLPGLLIAWAAYSWLRYRTANLRAEECYDLLGTGNQADICIRNAIETRDAVITWAIGVPLSLLIGASALVWLLGAIARERGKP